MKKVKQWSSLLILVLVLGCYISSSAASSLVLGIAGQKEVESNYTLISAKTLKMTIYSYSKNPVKCTIMGRNKTSGAGTQRLSLVYSGSTYSSIPGNYNYSKIMMSGWKNGYKAKGSHATAKIY